MVKLMLTSAILVGSAFAALIPGDEITYTAAFSPGASPPLFDKGHLIFLSSETPSIELFGKDGLLIYATSVSAPNAISTPNAPRVYLYGAAIDTDGTLGVAVGYASAPNSNPGKPPIYSGGIAFFDRSGSQIRFVDTGRYSPSNLCFAPDHSLWSFGWQRDAQKSGEDRTDYLMLRKYSQEGSQLGAYVSRSLFPAGLPPGGSTLGFWRMRFANDRIGILAYSGKSGPASEWMELDFEGHLIGHWPLGPGNRLLAFTSDHNLYASTFYAYKVTISVFDRATSSWLLKDVLAAHPDNEDGVGLLLGADGGDLVFSGKDNVRGVPLKWFSVGR
jgi:hypothetical protein